MNGGSIGTAEKPLQRCTWRVSIKCMRTTLDIDDDVLQAAKQLAAREKKTAGQVLSELARRGIHAPRTPSVSATSPTVMNGFEVLPAGGRVITPQLVQKLLDETEAR